MPTNISKNPIGARRILSYLPDKRMCTGPIIQVTPDELHISDPSYYKHLFVTGGSRKTDMYPGTFRGTPFEGRFFLTIILLSLNHRHAADSHLCR